MDALQGYLEKSITLRQMKCGGQENGYDCGIFLLAATEELCNRCLNSDTNKEEENGKISWDLPLDISRNEFSTRFRNSLLLLINQLRFNGLRQDQT